jgi:arginine-tRNA-protein transferase
MENKSKIFVDIIDQSIAMTSMSEPAFDSLMEGGWRLLGKTIVRHNFAVCRSALCTTIPLRIRLRDFTFSKSQRRLLRRAVSLEIREVPIKINEEKKALFLEHTNRFNERQPDDVHLFIGPNAAVLPVAGKGYDVYDAGKLVASSFFHLGKQALCGTYCFFDPTYTRHSLGTLTMLKELEFALENGFQYYYHGYCYDVPSQFDYKCNFNGLECRDWKTDHWNPLERIPPRSWKELL